MKVRLNRSKSKYILNYLRCLDFKIQLSFFGFTLHYINDDWQIKEEPLAFKFLEGEHDGKILESMIMLKLLLVKIKSVKQKQFHFNSIIYYFISCANLITK